MLFSTIFRYKIKWKRASSHVLTGEAFEPFFT